MKKKKQRSQIICTNSTIASPKNAERIKKKVRVVYKAEEAELKLKIDKSFYEIKLFELSSNEKKLETIVQKAITIVLVFNLDDRNSFENLGNKLIQQLKSFKFENEFYILGSSPNNQKSTCLEEVNALIQTCELQGKYFEINDFDQKAISTFFETVFKESADSLKTKKKPDKNTVNTSCIVF